MRRLAALTIAALAAGCGGDEPAQEPAQEQGTPPAEELRPIPPAPPPEATQQGESDPPSPAESAPAPVQTGDLYTVQVAAFLDAATAREWAGRLRSQDMPVWTSEARVQGRTFHRLRVGALPSVSDTRRLGAVLTERYHWPVWIAPLSSTDRLPGDAVQASRRILQGG
jgi:DedD protein